MCVWGVKKERKWAEVVGRPGGEVGGYGEQVLCGNLSTQMCYGTRVCHMFDRMGGERGVSLPMPALNSRQKDEILL